MSYDTRNEGTSSGTRQELRPDHNMNITARNEQGQFVSLNKDRQLDNIRDNRDEVITRSLTRRQMVICLICSATSSSWNEDYSRGMEN